MPARTVRIQFTNNTPFDLHWMDDHLDHGEWTDPWFPSKWKTIPGRESGKPPTTAEWRSESGGGVPVVGSVGTGTAGWAKFAIDDPAIGNGVIYIHWSNPFIGNVTYDGWIHDSFNDHPVATLEIDQDPYLHGTPGFFNFLHYGQEHAETLLTLRTLGSTSSPLTPGIELLPRPRPHSGNFIQGAFGHQGNFEVVLVLNGKLVHYWRDNDAFGLPWHGATLLPDGGRSAPRASDRAPVPMAPTSVALIESNFNEPGNLEVIARMTATLAGGGSADSLVAYARDRFGWHGPTSIEVDGKGVVGVQETPAFIQSAFGTKGNFEMVVVQDGQLAHYWRDNDARTLPWRGPAFLPKPSPTSSGGRTTGIAAAPTGVALLESTFGDPGNLEVFATMSFVVEGAGPGWLAHYWRDDRGWHGPFAVRVGGRDVTGVTGTPAALQSIVGATSNFELLVIQDGKLAHYWRDNASPGLPWRGPTFLPDAASSSTSGTRARLAHEPTAVTLIQSNFGGGNLEALVVMSPLIGGNGEDYVVHYWRDDTGWHGPEPLTPNGSSLAGSVEF